MRLGTTSPLKRAFGSAAMIIASYMSAGSSYAEDPSPEPTPEATQEVSIEESWQNILQNDTTPFDYGEKLPERPEGNTIAVQFESYSRDLEGLMLHREEMPTFGVLERHGHAAAKMIDKYAERHSERSIDTYFIQDHEHYCDWIANHNHPMIQTVFQKADVICVSMGPGYSGDQFEQYAEGDIDTIEEIYSADSIWENSSAIFVQSTSNSGKDNLIELERAEATYLMRGDTFLRIGEARIENGIKRVVETSGRSGPSFVTVNPFFHDFRYPYIKDKESARKDLEMFYNSPTPGRSEEAVKWFFIETLKERCGGPLEDPEYPPPTWKKGNPFYSCHPDFYNASFPGKHLLMASKAEKLRQPEAVWEAYKNGIIDAINYRRRSFLVDQNRNMAYLNGASYTAPYAASLFAAMHEKYPEFSEYDLVAAALITAEPVTNLRGRGDVIKYYDNGRGLPFNSYNAGFGLVLVTDYKKELEAWKTLLDQDPSLETVEQTVRSEMIEYDIDNPPEVKISSGQPFREYKITMTENIVAHRANFSVDFSGPSADIPVKLRISNPKGGFFYVSPTKLREDENRKMEFSLCTTDGTAGVHTEGNWFMRIPGNLKLERAQLTIHGSQIGGLFDARLNQLQQANELSGPRP